MGIGAYDVKSIMHYEEYDFSVSWGRKKVMVAKDGTSPLSNHNGFTELDVFKIKTLYQCDGSGGDGGSGGDDGGATKICQDLFSERACKSWKSSSLQPCTADKYRYYMMDVCAKTCNFCGCFDKHPPICQSWSRSGVCNWSKILQYLHITPAIFIDVLFEESSIISDWPISFKFKKFIKKYRLIFYHFV